MERGYLALWRKIKDHPFYKQKRKFSKFEAWVDILMEAQHSENDQEVVIGNDVLICHYGESLKSLRTWASRWNWSEPSVRRYFDLLKKMNQIDKKSEGKTTRITILNYSNYDPKRRKPDANLTQKRRKPDANLTTDNNVKHENNENMKENTPLTPQGAENDFDKFWNMYSKKKDRKKCERKWKKLKQADKDKIFETLPVYISSTPDPQFRKNPFTYLNGECWNDDITADQSNIDSMPTRQHKTIAERKAEELAEFGQLVSNWDEIERNVQK